MLRTNPISGFFDISGNLWRSLENSGYLWKEAIDILGFLRGVCHQGKAVYEITTFGCSMCEIIMFRLWITIFIGEMMSNGGFQKWGGYPEIVQIRPFQYIKTYWNKHGHLIPHDFSEHKKNHHFSEEKITENIRIHRGATILSHLSKIPLNYLTYHGWKPPWDPRSLKPCR